MGITDHIRRQYACDHPGCTNTGDTDHDPAAGDGFVCIFVELNGQKWRAVVCRNHAVTWEPMLKHFGFRETPC